MDKKTRTKNAILNAAKEAFLKEGYHKTDIGHIAEAVGVDKRTIYRYFSSKEALAFAVWQDVLAYVSDLGARPKGNTGYERIENLLLGYMTEAVNSRHILRFLGEFDHVFSGEYPHIEEAESFVNYITSSEDFLLKHLKEGAEDGSVRPDIDMPLTAATISNILIAMGERVAIRGEHLKVEQGYSQEMLDCSVYLLLEGIKPR